MAGRGRALALAALLFAAGAPLARPALAADPPASDEATAGLPQPPDGMSLPPPGLPVREWLRGLPPDERTRARDWWRALPPEQRRALTARQSGGKRAADDERLRAGRDDRAPAAGRGPRLDPEARSELHESLAALSPEERARLRARFRELEPEQRREVAARIVRLRELPPEEQDALRERLQRWRERPVKERESLRRDAARWRSLSEEERAALRAELERYRALPRDERRALMERYRAERRQGRP